ncbi:General alpha-glucoside permease, partial [Colletotrichum sp. SAR11_239]
MLKTLLTKMAFTFRYYWKAVAWSLCVSNATIMESYDLLLINSFYAFPQFQKKYGVELPNGSYSVPARWQIGLSMANLVGMIIGVFANGYCADRWGLRKVMMASHAALIGFIFITFFAPSVEVLTVGMLLLSLPCGFFAAATPSYAAEVSPPQLSGYLTVLVSAPITVIDPKESLATIVRTIEAERLMSIQGSYLDCFRGDSLRRTEIAMVSWGCQILPGFAIQNYITYFFTLAGLDSSDSFNLSIGNAGLAFVGTVSSWALMTRFGWRTMYLGGLIAMFPVMSLVGFLDLATSTPSGDNVRWAQCAMLLVWFFIYGASIGPVPYGIAAN